MLARVLRCRRALVRRRHHRAAVDRAVRRDGDVVRDARCVVGRGWRSQAPRSASPCSRASYRSGARSGCGARVSSSPARRARGSACSRRQWSSRSSPGCSCYARATRSRARDRDGCRHQRDRGRRRRARNAARRADRADAHARRRRRRYGSVRDRARHRQRGDRVGRANRASLAGRDLALSPGFFALLLVRAVVGEQRRDDRSCAGHHVRQRVIGDFFQ